jgi:hypothetical protein
VRCNGVPVFYAWPACTSMQVGIFFWDGSEGQGQARASERSGAHGAAAARSGIDAGIGIRES